ncbi:hypothetical protein WNY37_18470 [Henriciella sp. AS95]|uniref:hypothetical protein n=1 Tax=Henriciella sp. AS95 TaxID=3135782 RepID=UPI0031804244
METHTYNSTEITDVIVKAIEGDASLSSRLANVDAIIIASTDNIISSTDDNYATLLEDGGRILLVQVWPQSSRLSLVALRRLSDDRVGLPWSVAKAEYAIDWASELSISGAYPLFAHIVDADHHDPVFFNHTVISHTGRNIDYFDLNVQDLRERFPRAMERITDRMMFLVKTLPNPSASQHGWA